MAVPSHGQAKSHALTIQGDEPNCPEKRRTQNPNVLISGAYEQLQSPARREQVVPWTYGDFTADEADDEVVGE